MNQYSLEVIMQLLTTQRFADFYSENGSFGRWLMGDENAPSENEAKKELKTLLDNTRVWIV